MTSKYVNITTANTPTEGGLPVVEGTLGPQAVPAVPHGPLRE